MSKRAKREIEERTKQTKPKKINNNMEKHERTSEQPQRIDGQKWLMRDTVSKFDEKFRVNDFHIMADGTFHLRISACQ